MCIDTTAVFVHATVLCFDDTVVCQDAMVVYPTKPFLSLETTVVFLNKEVLPSNLELALAQQTVGSVLRNGESPRCDAVEMRRCVRRVQPKAAPPV